MLKEERFRIILKRLEEEKRVLLGSLSKELEVSEDTVRRDIRELSDQGLLKAVRGGAVPHAPGPHTFRERVHYAGKFNQAVAAKALALLEDGQVVILDGGTSALALASMLPEDRKITVVTNSFPVASVLEGHKGSEVLFAGGKLFKDSYVTVGWETIRFFQKIRADMCFLGICSIHLALGVTGPDYEESEVKKVIVESSKQVIALAALEKMDTAEPFFICPANELSTIITDVDPGDTALQAYRAAGIKLL